MSQQEPESRNDLDRRLAAMHAGQIGSDRCMDGLLASQIFMPVKDRGYGIADFHASQKAEPLSLTAEDGTDVLILFTSPERATPFLIGSRTSGVAFSNICTGRCKTWAAVSASTWNRTP